jgi:hypothetical protein
MMTLTNTSDNSIDKALWAKILPRKYVTYATHASNVKVTSAGSDYVDNIEFEKADAITPSRKTSIADLTANGHWYFDRDSGNVYFYYSGSNSYLVLVLGIFVTTSCDTLAKVNFAGDAFNDLIVYEGRLLQTSFAQSCEDILSGKLGIYTASIGLINNDSRYNYLASDDISFKNAGIKVYLTINELTNDIMVFNGLCENASFSGNNLSITVVELTKALQQEATFGDSRLWSTINATTWPLSKDEDRYKIIPMFLGGMTNKQAVKTKLAYFNPLDPTEIYRDYSFYDVDPTYDFMLKYVANETGSAGVYGNGKKFVVCRLPGSNFPQNYAWFVDKSSTPLLIDSIAAADITLNESQVIPAGTYYGELTIEAKSTSVNNFDYLYPGMHVYLRDISYDPDYYFPMLVTFIDAASKKFGVRPTNGETSVLLKVTGHTYQLHYRGPTVYTMKDGVPAYLAYDHFWFQAATTDGGNSVIYCNITFNVSTDIYVYYVNNEIKLFNLYYDTLAWNIADVPELEYYCRFLTINLPSTNAATVLNYATRRVKEITTDSASDTLVTGNSYYDYLQNTGASAFVDIISPGLDSTENESYLDVIEKILASTMAFLCMDTSGRLIVRLFESEPYGSVILALTEDDIADRSIE